METFFLTFFGPFTYIWIPVVRRFAIASHLRLMPLFHTMDFPRLPESAPPFLSTGSNQAVFPSQLSLASCLSPDGTLDVDKYRRYTAYRLAKARGRSEAILSTMFVGGESHAASVEQQGNPTIVKPRRSRCVLGRKDTEGGPLCVITPEESGWYRAYVNNFLLEEPESFMGKATTTTTSMATARRATKSTMMAMA